MFNEDTIAAIATSSLGGSISIIRVSGENAVSSVDDIVSFGSGKKLSDMETHRISYGFIRDKDGTLIDEVIILLMRGPSSYTREDVVEIQCHGGSMCARQILSLLCSGGKVRIAEPGEFTKRAFLNGRIDLSQAEAVMDVIESKSNYSLKSAVSQLHGKVKEKIINLRKIVLDDISYIEAALDDPEHFSLDEFDAKFEVRLKEYRDELQKIIDNFNNGRLIKEGINTVIVGKPNVGKSSFMNSILGAERAIVTDIPGTTRDVIREDVVIGNILLHLIDTAGIHDTDNRVEMIGIEKAKEHLTIADLCILILDGSRCLDDEDVKLINNTSNMTRIILINKNDLETKIDLDKIKSITDDDIVEISAKSGNGIEEFENIIKEKFDLNVLSFNDEIYLSNQRQLTHIEKAKESIENVMVSMENMLGEDFYTIDLMDAYTSLGYVIGESVDDDLIDNIFKKFCIGK
ncbi:tRNA uridine-5-carboxymethylaminomethyl(34) synthesis GTPase MnmE [Eubacterium xylanophilum]|uniref:tRNA uridine-5-carboxymethylaminomethyl(34) synthesis GTPase MnmE n=1 Tax=Eubacterium xylanophilum TaxID=39497 RepID=UPI00047887F4|nr:tRNA uridine-5-carboxymethylaminomethyl(34) synthesis GTPase MnmE [Eubacterium xylanophilum]